MSLDVLRTIPILRIFSPEKAREFYIDFLGFTVEWEHRYAADLPVYMQVSRGGLVLHLSEHHGDCCPGAQVFVEMRGVEALHAELSAKRYRNNRPGIEEQPWGARTLQVIDPFGSRITFVERHEG